MCRLTPLLRWTGPVRKVPAGTRTRPPPAALQAATARAIAAVASAPSGAAPWRVMSKSRSGKVGTVMPAAIASARAQGSPAARAEAHRDGRSSEAAPRPEAARNDRRERRGSGYVDMWPPAGRVTCAGHGSPPANYGGTAAPPTGTRRRATGGGQGLGAGVRPWLNARRAPDVGRPRGGPPVRRLLLATTALAALAASPPRGGAGPPITGLTIDWSTFRQLARGSDNWATTWAADGSLYAGFGDGNGFQGGRQSLGFARLTGGSAQAVQGTDLPGTPAAGKTYGVLALGDTLYAFVSPGSNAANYREARLYRAPPGGGPWTRAGWAFTDRGPERLVLPAFLQDGRGYAGGGPWVYAYAPRYAPRTPGRLSIQDGTGSNGIVLMRAPRDDLMDRGSWQFFAGLQGGGPLWSADPGGLRPVLNSAAGVGWTVSAIHDRALGRYLLATEYGRSFAGRIALYEAAHPWGPWNLAVRLRLKDPGGRAGTRAFYANILPNTLSADGKGLTLAFTGVGGGDALNLVDGRLVLGGAPAPQGSAPAAQRRALLKGAARRGAAVVADALRQARQAHAGTGLDAAAPAFGLDEPA